MKAMRPVAELEQMARRPIDAALLVRRHHRQRQVLVARGDLHRRHLLQQVDGLGQRVVAGGDQDAGGARFHQRAHMLVFELWIVLRDREHEMIARAREVGRQLAGLAGEGLVLEIGDDVTDQVGMGAVHQPRAGVRDVAQPRRRRADFGFGFVADMGMIAQRARTPWKTRCRDWRRYPDRGWPAGRKRGTPVLLRFLFLAVCHPSAMLSQNVPDMSIEPAVMDPDWPRPLFGLFQ